MQTKIVLADDHRLVREGLRRLLEEREGFQVDEGVWHHRWRAEPREPSCPEMAESNRLDDSWW